MMKMQPGEEDWKLFRAMVPELRERYLEARNNEVISILQDESLSPTEKFWQASERMEEIGSILGMCLDGHRRSEMVNFMMLMYQYRFLTDCDLVGFSGDLRDRMTRYKELQKEFQQCGGRHGGKP